MQQRRADANLNSEVDDGQRVRVNDHINFFQHRQCPIENISDFKALDDRKKRTQTRHIKLNYHAHLYCVKARERLLEFKIVTNHKSYS